MLESKLFGLVRERGVAVRPDETMRVISSLLVFSAASALVVPVHVPVRLNGHRACSTMSAMCDPPSGMSKPSPAMVKLTTLLVKAQMDRKKASTPTEMAW